MHTTPLTTGLPGFAAESFGRIGACRPLTSSFIAAGSAAPAGALQFAQRSELDAIALRAAGASGFGDAPVAAGMTAAPGPARPAATAPALMARLRAALARLHAQWRQSQRARATRAALQSLDARALRDLGIDRSEIDSVAAELRGATEITRARCLQPHVALRA
jgi:uncharacterized protein YjiS (DUF1127 family)